ncbi:MAG: GNAT family N-acetyltransferase [Roseburia sp.]|nr:GNAT family N-acetyltransferase [Roseburia sp.]
MVIYEEFDVSEMADVIGIYEEVGWSAYLQDVDKLFSAFENSLYLLGAYDNDELIGFARVVGDGEHVVLVQDLIVKTEYQNKGIGSCLFEKVMKKYQTVRMRMVVTDLEDKRNNTFYQKFGMKELKQYAMIGYVMEK